jgi:nucleoside-diphosphate-sugar epimerase
MFTPTILPSDLDHVLAYTRELWEELRGERLFLTGGTGFFGCWLLESLAWANDRLGLRASALVLTRDPESFSRKAPHLAGNPALQFQRGDVRSFEFPAGSFAHILHAANESSEKNQPSDPAVAREIIVQGTRRVLDFAASCGAKRFLFTSSGAVYGAQPPGLARIPEDYPGRPDAGDPKAAYGNGKREAEALCEESARRSGFEAKIARGFAFVGPYLPLDVHFAIGNFIRDGLRGGPIVVHGDGTPHRSYLYAADLAVWLWTILIKGPSLRPYNVGSDETHSIADVARRVAEQFPGKIPVEIRGLPDSNKSLERYVPDIQRARNELNLDVWTGLESGIRKTILNQLP